MKRVYSNIEQGILLLTICHFDDITESRKDLSPESECLQAAAKKIPSGIKFRPHRHNEVVRNTRHTQEAWVVLQGKILAKFYDLDDQIILEEELSTGSCAIVYRAGHGFEVLEDETVLYEFKSGPYFGSETDKEFID